MPESVARLNRPPRATDLVLGMETPSTRPIGVRIGQLPGTDIPESGQGRVHLDNRTTHPTEILHGCGDLLLQVHPVQDPLMVKDPVSQSAQALEVALDGAA